ncbi:PREDICTED: acyl-CoA wax alcohol acyltransferase 1 [Condylura cristata]|uniref:acyl-CoA wax alcohol acyltransferase 1 n=1 Tax=Condylura cristata TaxID=143302 RepID=UPI00033456E4|nr:PREDICTED: acyl-CoA wax alcohol acyltransferase 1 [Condylura cristata]
MHCSKQPRYFQSLLLLHWPLSYFAIFFILLPLFVYLLFTSFWLLPVLYFVWFFLDWKTPDQGGRRSAWVRNWCVWTHIRDYFPIMIVKTKDLSPEHNYLMGIHPHGLLTYGAFCNFCTEATGFSKIFPGITPYLATLSWFFKIPLIRDYLMAKGVCPVSQSAINYMLSHGTGNLVGIVVGGVGEALKSVPNTTTLILQKHRGFVRTALQHGAHLVPAFVFGETEVYEQVQFHQDSWMYKFQSCFRRIFGFYCCIFYGQGFRPGSIGLLPYKLPIITVVGEPLPLPKIEKPSQEVVNKYHTLYMEALHKLFDQHKTQYGFSETAKLLYL